MDGTLKCCPGTPYRISVKQNILSRLCVNIDGVWIDEWIY
jgi:hypothetical protein